MNDSDIITDETNEILSLFSENDRLTARTLGSMAGSSLLVTKILSTGNYCFPEGSFYRDSSYRNMISIKRPIGQTLEGFERIDEETKHISYLTELEDFSLKVRNGFWLKKELEIPFAEEFINRCLRKLILVEGKPKEYEPSFCWDLPSMPEKAKSDAFIFFFAVSAYIEMLDILFSLVRHHRSYFKPIFRTKKLEMKVYHYFSLVYGINDCCYSLPSYAQLIELEKYADFLLLAVGLD